MVFARSGLNNKIQVNVKNKQINVEDKQVNGKDKQAYIMMMIEE